MLALDNLTKAADWSTIGAAGFGLFAGIGYFNSVKGTFPNSARRAKEKYKAKIEAYRQSKQLIGHITPPRKRFDEVP